MKYISVFFIIIMILLVSYYWVMSFKANYLEDGAYWNARTVQLKSDAVGRLESKGEDLRIYEFTPQTNKKKRCVFVSGTSKASMECWDK